MKRRSTIRNILRISKDELINSLAPVIQVDRDQTLTDDIQSNSLGKSVEIAAKMLFSSSIFVTLYQAGFFKLLKAR